MQDTNEAQPAEVEEVIEVVTAAKLMIHVVTIAATTITDAQVPKASALRRRRGVVIQDPEETTTALVIMNFHVKYKDKGKGILIEEPNPLKRQEQIEQDETFARQMEAKLNANINWDDVMEQARKNMMIYLKNMAGFKMDFFKGMTYNDIRPIFEKHYNSIKAFLEKGEEEIEEEGSKRKGDSLDQDAAKKQKIDEEVEELKTHLQIIANDDDDVYIEATLLALKTSRKYAKGLLLLAEDLMLLVQVKAIRIKYSAYTLSPQTKFSLSGFGFIQEMINRRMAKALEAHEISRNIGLENRSRNGNGNGGNGNGNGGNKNGNGGNGNGQGENGNVDGRGDRHVVQLTMMYTKMVPEEEDRVERFIKGLPDNIQGSVMVTEPTRLQDVVRMANNMMDKKLKGYAIRSAKNKRVLDVNQRENHGQPPPFKRQNTRGQNDARAYTAGNNKTRGYEDSFPYCNRYQESKPWKKARNPDTNPGSNTVTGTFLLNDHHAYMLFDLGADRSFVLNTFSTLLDITPSALDVSYAVELANEKTLETISVLSGCTLGLLGHPLNIDLMPIDLGSFDVIIGMDWLAKNHAVIVCDEKIVRIPYGNEILVVQGDKSDEKKSMLSIISYVKAHKYMEKGCKLFLP
nr:reverse transcriptase domain-containing protein [Tanacetum cinerariifolium]